MFIWRNIYRHSLRLVLRVLTHCRRIPNAPERQLGSDSGASTLYVLPHQSETDLLTLHQYCVKNHLPDPLVPITLQNHQLLSYLFISNDPWLFSGQLNRQSVTLFHLYLSLLGSFSSQSSYRPPSIQVVLVTLVWGRTPGYGSATSTSARWRWVCQLQKMIRVIWFGRDSFIYFANPLQLGDIANRFANDQLVVQKLARLARIHLFRYYRMITGPQQPKRKILLNQLLQNQAIQQAIASEARSKQGDISKSVSKDVGKTTTMAMTILNEIAAHFSYGFIRIADSLFVCLWHHLYQGITVNNAEQVRQRALAGDEIIYVPCHRSHMDYLLLSFVLYHQGLVPPHIAAGINLNFWPVGSLFRRSGAFFIRRSFNGNKLYSTVFREYLAALFAQGSPVEYFIEGGRSRTGRLLTPKTGLLTMTLQIMLRGTPSPLTLVPVYIGYEHVMEERTYAKERGGAVKQPENFQQLLGLLSDLRHLGRSYVNFGEPIQLTGYMDQQRPSWRKSITLATSASQNRSNWMAPIVNQLAQKIMVDINKAAAVNAVNLCVTVLLAADKNQLPRSLLRQQLTYYLNLLRNVPYSTVCTIPFQDAEQLIEQALKMKKLRILGQDPLKEASEEIALLDQQADVLVYYRNNIQHLLAIPSLVANLLLSTASITDEEIVQSVIQLYPLLQGDLFIEYSEKQLPLVLRAITSELVRAQLIQLSDTPYKGYCINPSRRLALRLLAANTYDLLQQYFVTLNLLLTEPQLSRGVMEHRSEIIAKKTAQHFGDGMLIPSDKRTAAMILLQAPKITDQAMHNTSHTVGDLLELLQKILPPARLKFIKSLIKQG